MDSKQQSVQNSKTCRVLAPALIAMLFLLSTSTHAQPSKVWRIGFLVASSASSQVPRVEAFRGGLRDLGYIEGQNMIIELRSGEGKPDRLPVVAAELVQLKVDVIVTGGGASNRTAKATTSTIPIVMTQDDDPIGNGLVASLGHPGGNVTGLSNIGADIVGKRLELLKQIVPKLSRVTLFIAQNQQSSALIKEVEVAGQQLGLRSQILVLKDAKDIDSSFEAASKNRAGAILAEANPVLLSQRNLVADFAVKSRLPVIYNRDEYLDAGGLMVYAASITDLSRRAATFVDKILKGAKPADLPVEQATKFEFVVNLKAAKQIGLTIPPNVLARADRVIR